MRILVTGAAGFIGFHVSSSLLRRGDQVDGVDNLNDYYDVALKEARLALLQEHPEFKFIRLDIAHRAAMENLFAAHRFDAVVHLAAQAGVRYSLTNPHAYVESNIVGFTNILEGCRHSKVRHLVFASSSSVYGANTKLPFSVLDNVDHPVSLYAATKKSNELFAHAYSHLYQIPITGLRFFTVYGPWGRPDMAVFSFTRNIIQGEPIQVFNHGVMARDFTYIDDVVGGVVRVLDAPPQPDSHSTGTSTTPDRSHAPYRIYNIGNHEPVDIMHFIETLERALGKKAKKVFLPMQPGDVLTTFADIEGLTRDFDYRPSTSIEFGLNEFVTWYRSYYDLDRETQAG
jgi:UDP-glucuronate 4-epimerase